MLGTIALRTGTRIEDLRRWNGLEGDRILVGQELVVAPEGAASASAARTEPATDAARPAEAAPPETPAQASAPRAEPPAPATPPPAPDPMLPQVVVERGDTLSHVARRAGVTLAALLAVNPGLAPDRVRAGQRVAIPETRRRVEHEVRRGERLADLAERYEVTTLELRRWNPELRRGLRAGATLVVFTDVPESRSESVGAANGGQLVHGERLPPHRGYEIRDAARAFGTVETVRWIVEAFDAVRAAHPDAPRVRIHDISRSDGGPLAHHRSHQSGRDADISYFYRRCGDVCRMRRINEGLLDVERQWSLFEHWLRRGVAQAIFVDYDLQAPLYEYARSRGATAQELHRWFQYPRGRTYPLGVIRHFPKHRDHLHVRFVCPESDAACVGR